MQGKLAQSLDVMAIVTDKEARTSEVLDIDQVYVVSYSVNHTAQSAQFAVGFGGMDSNGKLHLCPEQQRAVTQVTIRNPVFSELFEDKNGNPLRELSQDFLDKVFAEQVLPACNNAVWGMNDMNVSIDGKPAYATAR